MVQTIKAAMGRMNVDNKLESDEMLPVIVKAIRTKKTKDGHSPYELIFCTSHRWLLSVRDEVLPSDDPSLEDDGKRKVRKDGVIEVL